MSFFISHFPHTSMKWEKDSDKSIDGRIFPSNDIIESILKSCSSSDNKEKSSCNSYDDDSHFSEELGNGDESMDNYDVEGDVIVTDNFNEDDEGSGWWWWWWWWWKWQRAIERRERVISEMKSSCAIKFNNTCNSFSTMQKLLDLVHIWHTKLSHTSNQNRKRTSQDNTLNLHIHTDHQNLEKLEHPQA